MDQDAFRRTSREINERACIFEKSLLAGLCRCGQAERFCLAEREGIHCKSDEAQQHCRELIDLLRTQSRFALKSNQPQALLSHNNALRIQVGGVRGLHTLLYPDIDLPPVIDDIHGLIQLAIATHQHLDQLPLQPIIQQIAAYTGRKSRSDR